MTKYHADGIKITIEKITPTKRKKVDLLMAGILEKHKNMKSIKQISKRRCQNKKSR